MEDLPCLDEEREGWASPDKSSPVPFSSPIFSSSVLDNGDIPLDSFNKFCENLNSNNFNSDIIITDSTSESTYVHSPFVSNNSANILIQEDAHFNKDNGDAEFSRYDNLSPSSNKKRSLNFSAAKTQQKFYNQPAANINKRQAQDINDNSSPSVSSPALKSNTMLKDSVQDKAPFTLTVISNNNNNDNIHPLLVTQSLIKSTNTNNNVCKKIGM
ncbi:hypothetical protein PUN28_015249 [Cardiocondyla obscurior]|uniref:Uncharacterized protein n=1 Tax=Cardiocondyla obscurior TaxID=286306 RepID=A0AAW2F3F8_9HYME